MTVARRQQRTIRQELTIIAVVIVLAVGAGALLRFLGEDSARMFAWVGSFLANNSSPSLSSKLSSFDAEEPVGGCRHCVVLNEIHRKFERRARASEHHSKSLELALQQTDDAKMRAVKQAELTLARINVAQAKEAVRTLGAYAASCESQPFCKLTTASAPSGCLALTDDTSVLEPALTLTATVKSYAMSCAANACPSVSCAKAEELRSQLGAVSGALRILGTPIAPAAGIVEPKNTPVGASTLHDELKHIADETAYAARLFPMMLEPQKDKPQALSDTKTQRLPAMAPEMIAEEARVLQDMASDMVTASSLLPIAYDARKEAAWRLKALSISLSDVGRWADAIVNANKGSVPLAEPKPEIWTHLVDAWGRALVDLAQVSALQQRLADDRLAAGGCDGTMARAAQESREALALLDLCRLRAACPSTQTIPAGAADAVSSAARDVSQASDPGRLARGTIDALMPRAQATAGDFGAAASLSAETEETSQADGRIALAAEGICRQTAGELQPSHALGNGQGGPKLAAPPGPLPTVPALAPNPQGGTMTSNMPQPEAEPAVEPQAAPTP